MPPKRVILPNNRNQNQESSSGTSETPPQVHNGLTAEQIAQLVTAAVNNALAQQPENEEIRKMREEIRVLREQRVNVPSAQEEEMRRIREEVELLRNARAGEEDRAWNNPLSEEIIAEAPPHGFTFPNIGTYDGTGDLEEHLARFENTVLLYPCSDAIQCKLFLNTLVITAQNWCRQVPRLSIRRFAEFTRVFLHQFASSRRRQADSTSLFRMQRATGESLRDYLRRFNKVALEVPAAPPQLIVEAFRQGLREGDLFKSLVKKPPTTYDELMLRAEKYANVEEANASRDAELKRARRNKEVVLAPTRQREFLPRIGQTISQTQWRITKEKALEICDEKGLVRRPRGSENGPRRPRSSTYCHFHREFGHTTEECAHWGSILIGIADRYPEIKALLTEGISTRKHGRGEPNQQTHGRNMQRQGPRGNYRQEEQPRGYIHIISGGPAGGDSNRARKAGKRLMECMSMQMAPREDAPILGFGPKDLLERGGADEDALVIKAMIANYVVSRVFVDEGSSANILYKKTWEQMNLGNCRLEPVETALFGFTGHHIKPLGMIHLSLSLGKGDMQKTKLVPFVIVDLGKESSYNAILGRPAVTAFEAVASSYYQKIKYPVGNKVAEVRGDVMMARSCYVEEVRMEKKALRSRIDDHPSKRFRDECFAINMGKTEEVEEETEEVTLVPPKGNVRISRCLDVELKVRLMDCLKKNRDVFAWSFTDLVGIDRTVIEHRLNVSRDIRPVFKKKRSFGPEQDMAIREQVEELLKAGHIREVKFPTWLSNVVMVPKSAGKWRMCVDFRDLNKACPKDCYPLPRIDQMVDSTSEHELLCFLDAYQGYHQIRLAREDEDKVSFITSVGTFCYTSTPFGLKNAGATYQRLMDRIFRNQIGRNVEVYVDDILVKSQKKEQFVADLEETFSTARRYHLKLTFSNAESLLFASFINMNKYNYVAETQFYFIKTKVLQFHKK